MRFGLQSFLPVALGVLLMSAGAQPVSKDAEATNDQSGGALHAAGQAAAREIPGLVPSRAISVDVSPRQNPEPVSVVGGAPAFPTQKCDKNGCQSGATCSSGGGTKREAAEADTALTKREFLPLITPAFNNFPAVSRNNLDAGPFATRNTGFIKFTPKTFKSVRVEGLEGCTVVAAFSNQGMMVSHIFESGANGNTPDVEDTLHPNAAADTIQTVAELFRQQANKFVGGQLVVLLPVNSDGPNVGQRRYDTETWKAITPSGKSFSTVDTVRGPTIAGTIVSAMQVATGLGALTATYPVSAEDDTNNPVPGTLDGTFAIQYDPTNAPGATPRAVQVYVGGNAVLQQPFRF